jgi:hypothetical protein|tara:strand:- start:889 stop:1182 length:294 start_codon:yes stop_codon:yes gene_type:complete
MATYKKPRTKMGSVTGSSATTPTARGIAIPGTVRATIQDLAIRSASRKAPPAKPAKLLGKLDPRAYTSKPTLLQSLKKKAAAKKKAQAAKKKKKKKK